jgi:hypothetical protein
MTSVHDQLLTQGTVVPGDATSVVTTRGAVDQDDVSTQMDEDMTQVPKEVGYTDSSGRHGETKTSGDRGCACGCRPGST